MPGVPGGLLYPPVLSTLFHVVILEGVEKGTDLSVPIRLAEPVSAQEAPVLPNDVAHIRQEMGFWTATDIRMRVEHQPEEGRTGPSRADDEGGRGTGVHG